MIDGENLTRLFRVIDDLGMITFMAPSSVQKGVAISLFLPSSPQKTPPWIAAP